MRKAILIAAVVAMSAFFSQTHGQSDKITRQIPTSQDFIKGRVIMTEGAGRFDYLVNLIVANGTIELCGVLAFAGGAKKNEWRKFLQDSAFEINGKKVIKDLSYWNQTTRDKLYSSQANCRSTGVKESTRVDSLGMAWSQKIYRF